MRPDMEESLYVFNQLRPRLQKMAYRMLGSVAEAEDIVQEVWLRWHAADHDTIDNAQAWLVAVTTQPSASTGVDWIVPPSGIGTFQPSASLPTLSFVIVVSAVCSRWLSTVPP